MVDMHYGEIDSDGKIMVAKLDGNKDLVLPVYKIDPKSLYDLLRTHCGDLFVPGAKSNIQKSVDAVVLEYEPIFDVNGEGSYTITKIDVSESDDRGRTVLPVHKIDAKSLHDLLWMHCGVLSAPAPGAKVDVQRHGYEVELVYEPIVIATVEADEEGTCAIVKVDEE